MAGLLTPPLGAFDYLTAQTLVKPRNASEWKMRFAFWQTAESTTESNKIESIAKRIKDALDKDRWLTERGFRVIPQGSYHNRTNVRNDSDVDVCVRLNNALFTSTWRQESVPIELVGHEPLGFTFLSYRNAVATALEREFGADYVDNTGNKAIKLKGMGDGKITADVLPAFGYFVYNEKAEWGTGKPRKIREGVAFDPLKGNRVYNYPETHTANGITKRANTSLRFKRVVRILKRLRNHMAANNITAAQGVSSFLIESLVYNCDNDRFGNPDIYDDLAYVLANMLAKIDQEIADPTKYRMLEVSEFKYLFSDAQGWTISQARAFVLAAWSYVGF